mgnify:CR=1 FL=1
MTEAIHTPREIEALIPHRWPFLLVDRIDEYDADAHRIVGRKAVTATEWFFQGHFPGMPVMPGVLQVEALAQTMAVFVAQQEGSGDRIGLFPRGAVCRLQRRGVPGGVLLLVAPIEQPGRASRASARGCRLLVVSPPQPQANTLLVLGGGQARPKGWHPGTRVPSTATPGST